MGNSFYIFFIFQQKNLLGNRNAMSLSQSASGVLRSQSTLSNDCKWRFFIFVSLTDPSSLWILFLSKRLMISLILGNIHRHGHILSELAISLLGRKPKSAKKWNFQIRHVVLCWDLNCAEISYLDANISTETGVNIWESGKDKPIK